jgi:heme-binding NEAT domain protein
LDGSLNVRNTIIHFKIEELIFSPKPLEFNPIDNDSIEQTKKNNSNNKLESETTLPSSETESPRAPLTQGSKETVCNASSLIFIVVLGIAALLFIRNIHKR